MMSDLYNTAKVGSLRETVPGTGAHLLGGGWKHPKAMGELGCCSTTGQQQQQVHLSFFVSVSLSLVLFPTLRKPMCGCLHVPVLELSCVCTRVCPYFIFLLVVEEGMYCIQWIQRDYTSDRVIPLSVESMLMSTLTRSCCCYS